MIEVHFGTCGQQICAPCSNLGTCGQSVFDSREPSSLIWIVVFFRVSLRSRLLEFVLEIIVGCLCVCVCVACDHDDIPGSLNLFQGISMFTRLRFILQLQRCAFFGVVLSFCSLLIHNDLFSLAALFLALL